MKQGCINGTKFIFSLLCILFTVFLSLAQQDRQKLTPPPGLGRPFENATNSTMDEIIMNSMGGVGAASNMILADEHHILAELDMYLDKEQFLGMYEPPSPDEMIKMGIEASVRGTIPKSFNYVSDYSEDYRGSGVRTKRKAVRETRWRWTGAEIPYLFAKGHFSEQEEYMMRRAMTEWERYTCFRFRPAAKTDKNSVRFQNGVGCNSQLGMVGGVQVLNLQAPGCRYKGLYLHEIGHAMGLVHEHQLPDRDDYISILYQNVNPAMRIWFNKYNPSQVNQMNVKYEYSSVMHYGITAFSYDGKSQTIQAHDKRKEDSIGRVYMKELAYSDVHIVNLMYNCSNHCPNKDECGPDGHLDQNCRCICRDGSSDCSRSRRTNGETCVNNYDSWACYIWANQGECERNPFYMKQQCAKACGCGSGVNNKGGCADVFQEQKCQVWKERGDCVTNLRWMQINCNATCGLCGDIALRPQVNCRNSAEHEAKCDEWAGNGECVVNAQWMFSNCRKSCAYCDVETVVFGGNATDGDEDNMVCENTNPTCEDWARSGECESNPSWMIPNCRQACNKCDDGKCKNLYDDVQCQIWAQKLECLTNTDWMGKNCAKACGRGICEGTDPSVASTTSMPGKSSTTSSSVTSAPCRNLHKSSTECDVWAKNDHCNINPGWMRKNCAMACKVCSGGSATTKKPTDVIIDVGGGCQDEDDRCPAWAESGACDNNAAYNLKHCRKSCNNCNTECRDTNALCGIWEQHGHCSINPRYMMRQCQKSCKICSL
ncbi:hypothetical protein BsWGS_03478 [Bradybaena similaris]